jgi:hypothetical protein
VGRSASHAAAATLFGALGVMWMAPVLADGTNLVPGNGPGDNIGFVWNGWWMRHALATGQWPFSTAWLFAPVGADLTLHTHAALPSAVVAALSSGGSIVRATNIVVTLHLVLNLTAAYALLIRLKQPVPAAIVGALAFGWSPFVGGHLPGHFNLIAAWVLPLAALLLIDALETRRRLSRVGAGLMLAVAAYVDYYYAIYAALLLALLVVTRSMDVTFVRAPLARWQGRIATLLTALAIVAVGVAAAIAVTGGGILDVAGQRISMRTAGNPLSAAGLLALLVLVVVLAPRIRLRPDGTALLADVRRMGLTVAVAALALLPLVFAALRLLQQGNYVSQHYRWRSAPAGIDVGTFLLGNPHGLAWSALPDRAYGWLGIDAVEQGAWFGPGVLALCACAWLYGRREEARRWLAIGGVFFIWALGPYLVAFGHNLPILLPATLVRYVPIVANARIPSRAIVVVYLAAAVLCAMGVSALLARRRRGTALALSALVLIDYVPAAPPVYRLAGRMVDAVLQQQPGPGAVCELPMGLRDGFGERGRFDPPVLYYQTVHERPMTGGFIARLPPAVVERYLRDPVLGPLVRLSEGSPLAAEHPPTSAEAGRLLVAHRIRFVVVNRHLSPPDLQLYVTTGLPLQLLAEDANQLVYRVRD